MACESLEEFLSLETYRKSFNGDLQMARSKPIKMVVLEGFEFSNKHKGFVLALGAVDTKLMTALKSHAGRVQAVGKLALVDGQLIASIKSGKLEADQMKKALELAQVRRTAVVVAAGHERDADENEEEDDAPRGPLNKAVKLKDVDLGLGVAAAQADLLEFFRERASALQWHESEIKTQQDAVKKIAEVKAAILGLEQRVDAADKAAKALGTELKLLSKDAQSKFTPGKLDKLRRAITAQEESAAKIRKQIETQKRGLPALELLERKHGASRHGAQTDLALQARRAATGGVTPDQGDNIHGVSESRVSPTNVALEELSWHRIKVKVDRTGQRVVNSVEVVKHLLTELGKLDKVATDTASKFHSHELEREAVKRAIDMVKSDCVWKEIQEGEEWKPLDTVTVYVGPPARGAGWGVSMARQSDPKKTVQEANEAIEAYRRSGNTKKLLADLDVLMAGVDETDSRGKTHTSVPMVKSCRVTLGRTSSGWTSITHFPDSTATPPGWSLTGSFVRKDARSPRQTAPRGGTP
jgi:hypothetical protein